MFRGILGVQTVARIIDDEPRTKVRLWGPEEVYKGYLYNPGLGTLGTYRALVLIRRKI